MIQGREHFCFALKPCEPIVVSRERGRQNLDRDLAFQLRVRRAKHLPHSALADLGRDFVGAETRAGDEGHECRDYMGERGRRTGGDARHTACVAGFDVGA